MHVTLTRSFTYGEVASSTGRNRGERILLRVGVGGPPHYDMSDNESDSSGVFGPHHQPQTNMSGSLIQPHLKDAN